MAFHFAEAWKGEAMKPYYILIILAIVCAIFSDKIGSAAKTNKRFRIVLGAFCAIILVFLVVIIVRACWES